MNEKEIAAKLRRLEAENERLREAAIGLDIARRQLEEENKQLKDESRELKETINRAKDIRPWQRPNFGNVRYLASRAFLDIEKTAQGYLVKMGKRIGRTFKRLRDIWLIITREDWNLHDEFFPHDEQLPTQETVEQIAPTRESLPVTPRVEVMPRPVVSSGIPADMEYLASEWRMFPSARPAIQELLVKVGLSPGMFGEA